MSQPRSNLSRGRGAAVLGFLLCAVAAVYGSTLGHGFVNYDDGIYVTGNVEVLRGITPASLAWAFASIEHANWHPLTWVSHQMDIQLFGLQPAGHHLVSVLWHAANTALLLALLTNATGAFWRCALVAALFALHPLHVESVAWIAERKDVLATFFWFAAILAHVRYARRPGAAAYLAVCVFGACGLMAKPMVVTLPLTLLILDYWPLGRLFRTGAGPRDTRRRALLEKLPLLIMAAGAGAVTLVAQARGGAVASLQEYPLAARADNALVSIFAYLGKTLMPVGLCVFYPFRDPGIAKASLAAITLAGLCAAAILARRHQPWLTTGWLWYLVTLLPVIGIVQAGDQSRADRYTYVPITGIFVVAAWALGGLRGRPARTVAAAGSVAAIFLLAALSLRQAAFWKDSETLMRHALDVDPANATARTNLGAAYLAAGRLDAAREEFGLALRAEPDHRNARLNLGLVHLRQGRYAAAAAELEQGLRRGPPNADAEHLLGRAYLGLGRPRAAEASFAAALRHRPSLEDARRDLDVVRARLAAEDRALP